jgi:hypothetical protein
MELPLQHVEPEVPFQRVQTPPPPYLPSSLFNLGVYSEKTRDGGPKG